VVFVSVCCASMVVVVGLWNVVLWWVCVRGVVVWSFLVFLCYWISWGVCIFLVW